jgi:hypothetical protein
MGSSKSLQQYPGILSWLSGFNSVLLYKATLVFFDNLNATSSLDGVSIASITKAFGSDYIAFIDNAVLKLESLGFLIMANRDADAMASNILFSLRNSEIQMESSTAAELSGLDIFPIVYQSPRDRDYSEDWPNIVSLIQWKSDILNRFDRTPLVQEEPRLRKIYFVAKISRNLFIVLIQSINRKSMNDAIEFMSGLSKRLRNVVVFEHLRPLQGPYSLGLN